MQALTQPALDLYYCTERSDGGSAAGESQWTKSCWVIPPISTIDGSSALEQGAWPQHCVFQWKCSLNISLNKHQSLEDTVFQRHIGYKNYVICPCVWSNDSYDTLLISIREAALDQFWVWAGIQCLAQGQLSRVSIHDTEGSPPPLQLHQHQLSIMCAKLSCFMLTFA